MNITTRRNLINTALTVTAGGAGIALAAKLLDHNGLLPPDGGGIYGPGRSLSYAAHRLLARNSLAREFSRDQISNPAHANGKPIKAPEYLRHQAEGFGNWRLQVDGLVARPASLSIADIKSYPSTSQITQIACEEGWSSISEWTGVRLAHILKLVEIRPQAKFIVFSTIQRSRWGALDMNDALHPQTLIAYGMNGTDIPLANGAPLRLRVPRQLGYASLKYINHMTVTDSLESFGKGLGSSASEAGYSWYAGI